MAGAAAVCTSILKAASCLEAGKERGRYRELREKTNTGGRVREDEWKEKGGKCLGNCKGWDRRAEKGKGGKEKNTGSVHRL